MKKLPSFSSIVKKKPFFVPPPFIVNNHDGPIFISDTEPLSDPPDNSWSHPIDVIIVVNCLATAPDTYSAVAYAESESSDAFLKFTFTPATDTLKVELNDLVTPSTRTSFATNPISFKPINSNPTLTVDVSKSNNKIGRKQHTISYANVRFEMKDEKAAYLLKPVKNAKKSSVINKKQNKRK